MVIIEANVRGAERIATFQSKAAVFYFLRQLVFGLVLKVLQQQV